MFTGLIQAIGNLQYSSGYELKVTWNTTQTTSMSSNLTSDLAIGDSVAVDGICLTVMQILPDGFIAAVSPETLNRTTLRAAQETTYPVNLEGSLRIGSKVGGHFVTGHIDGVGYLESSVPTETSWEMSFTVPDARIARYIVPKGSIAINGVSLTVADCNDKGTWFKVAVIPLTYWETNLQHLAPGSLVNLEGDVLGKYVEKFLHLQPPDSLNDSRNYGEPTTSAQRASMITPSFLAEHGYS